MLKFNNRFPCGDRKVRDLIGRLKHYQNCQHIECQDKGNKLIGILTEKNFLPQGDLA